MTQDEELELAKAVFKDKRVIAHQGTIYVEYEPNQKGGVHRVDYENNPAHWRALIEFYHRRIHNFDFNNLKVRLIKLHDAIYTKNTAALKELVLELI